LPLRVPVVFLPSLPLLLPPYVDFNDLLLS
jgi:hypothetical protein